MHDDGRTDRSHTVQEIREHLDALILRFRADPRALLLRDIADLLDRPPPQGKYIRPSGAVWRQEAAVRRVRDHVTGLIRAAGGDPLTAVLEQVAAMLDRVKPDDPPAEGSRRATVVPLHRAGRH